MIVVTGGEGFIGGNLVNELIRRGYVDVISLDTKSKSLETIYSWLMDNGKEIECIFHLGAITDTTIMNRNLFDEYNVASSIFMWNFCSEYKIPFIYASSAATYGDGSLGFNDEMDIIRLKPLNPYGWSKQQFDVWAEIQENYPSYWYGLKFFNVYGYGESHKGKMSSVVFHIYNQIKNGEKVKLFKSYNLNYKDGGQLRDFVYIDDVVNICIYMYENKPKSGIYNVGTGKSRSFYDLAKSVYENYYGYDFDFNKNLIYIPIPTSIKDKYQYFTEAIVEKLINSGYSNPFHKMEDGIKKYIEKLKNENFLKKD